MLKRMIFLVVLLVFGCAVKQPIIPEIVKSEPLFEFTATSWIEYNVWNIHNRTYHIRYSTDESMAPAIADLITGLEDIDGLSRMDVKRYKFEITKSPVYSWDEIEPEIKEAIEEFEKAEPEEPKTKIDRKGDV